MTKKEYMKPAMRSVELRHRTRMLGGSDETYGMKKKLRGTSNTDDEVEYAW